MTATVAEPDADVSAAVDPEQAERCQAAMDADKRCPLEARHELLAHCEGGHDIRSVFCCPHTGLLVYAHENGHVGCWDHQDAAVRLVAVVELRPH